VEYLVVGGSTGGDGSTLVPMPEPVSGFRTARIVDGEFRHWLCPHVHPSEQEATSCPVKRAAEVRDRT
jgi:hypothetical protein